MKYVTTLLLLISLGVGGCQTTSYVESALREVDPGLPIKSIRADGVWSTGEAGHGLQVHVWAETDASRYAPNLDLELDGAARVCAALARSDRVLEWAYIDVYYFNHYQQLAGATQRIVGVAEVVMRREALLMLREHDAPASEYPKHWRFVAGHKDQPGSRTPLSW